MSFEEEMITTKRKVEEILAETPKTRNNDFLLSWIYLRRYYPELNFPDLPHEVVMNVGGTMASVRRQRQDIQNKEGRYPPTDPAIMKSRRQRAEKYRNWFGASQGGEALDRGDYSKWQEDKGLRYSLEFWRGR